MRSIARSIFNWLFGCRHRQLTRVFTIEHQTYRVCLGCGARIPWEEYPAPPPPRGERKVAPHMR